MTSQTSLSDIRTFRSCFVWLLFQLFPCPNALGTSSSEIRTTIWNFFSLVLHYHTHFRAVFGVLFEKFFKSLLVLTLLKVQEIANRSKKLSLSSLANGRLMSKCAFFCVRVLRVKIRMKFSDFQTMSYRHEKIPLRA